jgi:uncharacterized protein
MTPRRTEETAIAQLCPACGLCCNGVLFGDVQLQAKDNPKLLTALGLSLQQKRKTFVFAQPCSCFNGKLCQIYADRPTRCRSFNCRLLNDVDKGHRTIPEALKAIKRARRHVKLVRKLLEALGETDETLPLSRRCAKIIAQPIDLTAGKKQVELRAKLMRAIHDLSAELQKNFLT